MSFFQENFLIYLFAFITGIILLVYSYLSHAYTYWARRGIPYVRPTFLVGNIGPAVFFRKQMGLVHNDIYTQLSGHKVGGFFQVHRPTLMIRDPELIKLFLVKERSHFHDRGVYTDLKGDPLSGNLIFLTGDKWKKLRSTLSPAFTAAKIKTMFATFLEVSLSLNDVIDSRGSSGEGIEVKDLIARYTTDVIASCAFGIQSNSLTNPHAEFFKMGENLFSRSVFGNLGFIVNLLLPTVGEILKLRIVPKGVSDFFLGVVKETIAFREKNAVERDDFVQLMVRLKNQGYVSEDEAGRRDGNTGNPDQIQHLSNDEVAAQVFVFFMGGLETTSASLSYCLYDVAQHTDVQLRMRTEMVAVLARHGGNISYDALQEMAYLDMVISETLRVHSVVPQINRICTEKYQLPDSGLVVEPGTLVVVPAYALHHDPQYYPDPERFDPERFTPEQKAKRNPYTYLPFGEGPRNCIGMRFGLILMKVVLVSLITQYDMRVSEKTIVPPLIDTRLFVMVAKGGLYLQFNKIEGSS